MRRRSDVAYAEEYFDAGDEWESSWEAERAEEDRDVIHYYPTASPGLTQATSGI